jgi:dTDP-4-dehydrorhamnose reductase
MNILVTGGKGQLANEIKSIIESGKSEIGDFAVSDIKSTFIDVEELDITNIEFVKKYINDLKPDVVINCAAFTNVNGCETNIDAAFKVNAIGPRNLAIACEGIGAELVHVSTDYVFPGDGDKAYREYDNTNPKSVYGASKLMGEKYVSEFCSKYYIVRTAWLYGYKGNNFVYTMIKLAKSNDTITVVNDQRGNPTNANDLAYHLLKLIETKEYGVYHCTGEGECSWYDFAKKIIDLSGLECEVKPCSTEEYTKKYPAQANRPVYSSLDNMMLRCTISNTMRNWKEAIKSFMNKINVEDVE